MRQRHGTKELWILFGITRFIAIFRGYRLNNSAGIIAEW
jgi:hypothetical protein